MPAARVVVITGASSGIGRATAIAFAGRGDHVVLVARRADQLARTLELCGGRGRTFVADVADRGQVAALASSVREVEGACHVLVNCAGIGARMSFDGPQSLDRLEAVMGVNFFGAAYATAELLSLLEASAPGSAIVNVTSIAGIYATPGSPIYCASKFALNGFGESLYFALRPRGIHVANVQPGPIPTEGFPHEGLVASRGGGLLTASAEDVARLIVRSSRPGSNPSPVLPRLFRWGLPLRACAPRLYRAILVRASQRVQMPHRADQPNAS